MIQENRETVPGEGEVRIWAPEHFNRTRAEWAWLHPGTGLPKPWNFFNYHLSEGTAPIVHHPMQPDHGDCMHI